MNDFKFALRQLLKNPGFTAVAVLTLALGIGTTTAIYSAVQTTLIDPLPVKDADRLMSIESLNATKGYSSWGVSLNTIAELRRHEEVFANVAVHDAMLASIAAGTLSKWSAARRYQPIFFRFGECNRSWVGSSPRTKDVRRRVKS